jgi:hypothetical protein
MPPRKQTPPSTQRRLQQRPVNTISTLPVDADAKLTQSADFM